MTVESATYLPDLNALYPASGDDKKEGDNHLRLLKAVLLATFPYIDGLTSGPLRAGANNYAAVSGTTNLSMSLTPALNAPVVGQVFYAKMGASPSVGALTMNIDSNGAGAFTWADGEDFDDGDIPANAFFTFICTSVTPTYSLLSVSISTKYAKLTEHNIGDVVMNVQSSIPKHLVCNGGTIGDGSSGGTSRANADTEDLFTVLWTETDNADVVIQDSSGTPTTRGASAAADFAAHKRMPLPNFEDYFPRGKSSSRGTLEVQEDAFQGHRHSLGQTSVLTNFPMRNSLGSDEGLAGVNNGAGGALNNLVVHNPITDGTNGTPRTATETRPKNIAIPFHIRYSI